MKRAILVMAGLTLMAVSQALAAVETQLVLDDNAGNVATIDVDDTGNVTCSGACGGLTTSYNLSTGHGTLQVTGSLGQFTINATGFGGLSATSPTLQNFNQIQAASSGSGTLSALFTDTNYCLTGGGGCFGTDFVFSASTVNDTGIAASISNFFGFVSGSNSIPAGTLFGSLLGLTGLSDSAAGIFTNPNGASGSLSTGTQLNFSGAGTIQANAQISTIGVVPEPASIILLGAALGLASLKLRRKFSV
jgi:PEP-CTERM motif